MRHLRSCAGLFPGLLLFLLFTACNSTGDQAASGTGDSFTWDTGGGGNLRFTATRTTSGTAFTIHVTRYAFATVDRTMTLSASDGAAFTSAAALLEGTLVLEPRLVQPGLLGGTWTSITLPTGEHPDVVMSDGLRLIYDFVADALSAQGPGASHPG
jgi:hypothetical protein